MIKNDKIGQKRPSYRSQIFPPKIFDLVTRKPQFLSFLSNGSDSSAFFVDFVALSPEKSLDYSAREFTLQKLVR